MCDADAKPNSKEDCNKQECRAEWVAQPFGTVIKSYKLINISLPKTGNVFMTGTAGIFHGSIVHFEEFVINL